MHKKIKVQLLVNEVAGNGNAIKADKELQDILKEMNIPFKRQKKSLSWRISRSSTKLR